MVTLETELETRLELDIWLLLTELDIREELFNELLNELLMARLEELITMTTKELRELEMRLLEFLTELLELMMDEFTRELITEELLDKTRLDDTLDETEDDAKDNCNELLLCIVFALLDESEVSPPPHPPNNIRVNTSEINLISSKLRMDRLKTSKVIKTLPSIMTHQHRVVTYLLERII